MSATFMEDCLNDGKTQLENTRNCKASEVGNHSDFSSLFISAFMFFVAR